MKAYGLKAILFPDIKKVVKKSKMRVLFPAIIVCLSIVSYFLRQLNFIKYTNYVFMIQA